ncbi:MAG: hypothetical protein MUP13_16440, partial [Thermoanaerobaculales bacterium]|nr:hypothetical protein [Thermoanaerobaculales bacterium]
IVSAHDGEVDVLSAPGKGARFIIRLPLAEAAGLEPLEGRTSGVGVAIRVLLVERDGRAAAGTVEALAAAGLEVRHAPSFSDIADLTRAWLPTVILVAEDAVSTTGSDLERLQLPVLLLGGAEDLGPQRLGPRVVRLGGEATPEAILDALRDLGE